MAGSISLGGSYVYHVALATQRNSCRQPTYTGTNNGNLQRIMTVVDQRVRLGALNHRSCPIWSHLNRSESPTPG